MQWEVVKMVVVKVLKMYGIWCLICVGALGLLWLGLYLKGDLEDLSDLGEEEIANDFFNDHGYKD